MDKINVKLKELKTPFGSMYIEPWEWHLNNAFPYDDGDRITIYDSRKDWFDYFSIDYFEMGDDTPEEEYNKLCEMIEKGAEKETVRDFMDWFGIRYFYVGNDKEEAKMILSMGHPEDLLPDEIESNEYVNHIGDNYIIVSDY